jgi:hypothetical protein
MFKIASCFSKFIYLFVKFSLINLRLDNERFRKQFSFKTEFQSRIIDKSGILPMNFRKTLDTANFFWKSPQ